MENIKAGVVVVTKFCRPGAMKFQKYIDYIDREEAVRSEHSMEYNLYADYMGNPEKTTGLFTADKDMLDDAEKKELKSKMVSARDNGSLMWQTVISFDNRWLEEHGLYDSAANILDEKRLKGVTRTAVEKMLKAEELEHGLWSAAIHYNTDNIHIHVATVETQPMRKKKEYVQYQTVMEDGHKVKKPVLDASGNLMKKEEYVGRFRQKSIELCKSTVVNEIMNDRDINLQINTIIRESILKQKKEIELSKDAEMRDQFLKLYEALPDVKRSLWNYNNNVMESVRKEIDALSEIYLKTYHPEEYQTLKELMDRQDSVYQQAYGNSGRSYSKTKMTDLFTRLGNQILKEMKTYDKELREQGEDVSHSRDDKVEAMPSEEENIQDVNPDFPDQDSLAEGDIPNDTGVNTNWWSRGYKKAKKLILSKEPDYKRALELLERERENPVALYELGNCYQYGRGVEIDKIKADEYYRKAFQIFMKTYRSLGEEEKGKFLGSYLPYRIGKQIYYGQGVEQNYEEARRWFKESAERENIYAMDALGNIYYYGHGVQQDMETAAEYYRKGKKFPYAKYKLAKMLEEGKAETRAGEFYERYYREAYRAFEKEAKEFEDDNLMYRMGMMNLKGQGVEQNTEKAKEFLEKSVKSGNANAQYQLAKIKMKSKDLGEIKEAVELLKLAADQGHEYAKKALERLEKRNWMWERRRLHSVRIRERILQKRRVDSALASLKKALKDEVEKRENEKEHDEMVFGMER
ncbi:MobP2 family relaxase [uncultured Merdimonas sp.]|uniref:MobP2 family relaxase n=1 Tax=uncultured Merdimonas sp. TaxID=2023269 RepID=UPI00320B8CCA